MKRKIILVSGFAVLIIFLLGFNLYYTIKETTNLKFDLQQTKDELKKT